jgi:L-ascorbate metabolism protein UlaG (beta-lactamase superfamily)
MIPHRSLRKTQEDGLRILFPVEISDLGDDMVNLRWFGHSCFEAMNKITVLMDPHDGSSMGLPAPSSKPDAVLISHHHDDHAGGRHLFEKLGVAILDAPGDYRVKGVKIKGIGAYHDDVQGSRLGRNVVFVFELEGVRFAHLGDVGHVLSPEQVNEMGSVDIIMVGVGRNLELAWENICMVNPRIVVPMHYWIEGIIFPYFPLLNVDEFVKDKHDVVHINKPEIAILREALPEAMEIYVFSLQSD